MRSAIVRIDESRVEVELIDLVKFRPDALGWYFRYPQVSYADLLMREGVHHEPRRSPFTPGWDLVGVVDELCEGLSTVEVGRMVASLPVWGGYAEFIWLPQEELFPVPAGLDDGEAVSLVMNYVTVYQMIRRSARVRPGQRALVHTASGGIGAALLQLGQLIPLETHLTAPERKRATVSNLGCIPTQPKKQFELFIICSGEVPYLVPEFTLDQIGIDRRAIYGDKRQSRKN